MSFLRDDIINSYFEWMISAVSPKHMSSSLSYRKLLMHLHNTEFIYSIPRDENRAAGGEALRYRFACEYVDIEDAEYYLSGPCSVLEMMVALAIYCEENIMDNTDYGNRTSQWFWGMITNMGLGSMSDDRYDRTYVDDVLYRFLHREYDPDGKGGLFRVRGCDRDLRKVEIWHQLCWYLDSIVQ